MHLQTDASDVGVGAILYFYDDDSPGTRKVIGYASRKMRDAERRYTTLEKEALAVVWAIENYKEYLEGRKFVLLTDNQVLSWMKASRDVNTKLCRWFLTVMGYDFIVKHVRGEDNEGPDGLSRAATQEPQEGDLGETVDVTAPSITQELEPKLQLN